MGGGGITGAAFEMATLMAIRLATGWDPNQSEVVVGTSAGSFVAALVRSNRLDLDSLVLPDDSRESVATRISERTFSRKVGLNLGRWLRHGLIPGVTKPGLTMLLGSPAAFEAGGVADWVHEAIGLAGDGWPDKPTVIVAYDVSRRRRVAFGTDQAPDVSLADAVAASSAIPVVFQPYQIGDRVYVDGGIVSGTHADLVLGNDRPLDLVLVLAPMAAHEERDGAWFHERMFDRVGRRLLDEELVSIQRQWPDTELLVLRPPPAVLQAMRPNPMDAKAAVPSFVRTLLVMKRILAQPDVWAVVDRHLRRNRRNRTRAS